MSTLQDAKMPRLIDKHLAQEVAAAKESESVLAEITKKVKKLKGKHK